MGEAGGLGGAGSDPTPESDSDDDDDDDGGPPPLEAAGDSVKG